MHKKHRHNSRPQPGFIYEIGRILFPDLINRPRALRARALALTLAATALLIGVMVGFYRRANDAGIMLIEAREMHR